MERGKNNTLYGFDKKKEGGQYYIATISEHSKRIENVYM